MLGRVQRGGHVLLAACRGPSEAAGLPARSEMLRGRVGGDIHVDVGVAGDDHRVPPVEAACSGIHLYVGPERRLSRPRGAACLRPVDVDEGEASTVRADLQGRGLPGDNFREAEHLVLRHLLAAYRGEEAPPSRGGGGSRLRQPAAEEGGVPLVPERRGHVHLLRPGGDPRFLEHDGKVPLLGQHAGDEVLHSCYAYNWHDFQLCWANPPWSNHKKMVTKAVHNRAQVVVICPDWSQTGEAAAWRPFLDRMTKVLVPILDVRLYLPRRRPVHYKLHAGEALHLSSMAMVVIFLWMN